MGWGRELPYGRNRRDLPTAQARKEVAELLQAILDRHPTETVYVAWTIPALMKTMKSRRSFGPPPDA